MGEKPSKTSMEYFVITQFLDGIKTSSNTNLRETYENGKLVYLDDDMEIMNAFIVIIRDLTENLFDAAPNHLKGDFKEISEREVKDILGEHDILIYGRSGMRVNSLELKRFES